MCLKFFGKEEILKYSYVNLRLLKMLGLKVKNKF